MDHQAAPIMILLPCLQPGGAERVMLSLAEAMWSRGLPVELVLLEPHGSLVEQIPAGLPTTHLYAPGLARGILALVKVLRQRRPAVILSALDLTSWMVLVARRLSGVQTRIVVRESTTVSRLPRSWLKKKIEPFLLHFFFPQADQIVAVSQGVAEDLALYASISRHKIQVIYNPGIVPDLVEKKLKPVDHPWFAPGAPPVILTAGRMASYKDQSTLVRAFAQIRQIMPVHLIILGEGNQRENLERQIRDLGLESDVQLPGFERNVYAFMSRARVFVLSSILEGLPNVLIEAMSCGCPVVSTDCPSGPREILADGRYGHLTPMGDASALAQAILAVLAGDTRLADAAWLDQFRSDRVLQQYLQVLGIEAQA